MQLITYGGAENGPAPVWQTMPIMPWLFQVLYTATTVYFNTTHFSCNYLQKIFIHFISTHLIPFIFYGQQYLKMSNLNKLLWQITDETEKPDISTSVINQCLSTQWHSTFLFTE